MIHDIHKWEKLPFPKSLHTEHARVFWPYGTDWVDAMPRPATREEVSDGVLNSLRRWF